MLSELLKNEILLSSMFCFVCAFVLYQLSGLIGKMMLNDKGVDGRGVGYQDIIFGKERKESLVINIQYNIFAPLIFALLIASVIQYMGVSWLLERVIYVVPCYYVVRAVMINVFSGKHWLYNWRYEIRNAVIGTVLALFVQYVLILSGKPILPTVEEFRTQMWLVIIALVYGFFIRVYGKSPKIRQDNVCTNEMKQAYIREKYKKFKNKYHGLIKEIAPGNFLQSMIYAIMIYEDYNRTWMHRWCENILFRLGKRPMTLGVMQVMTSVFIDNARSVELGSKKIKQSFSYFIEEKINENGGNYFFEVGEPENCIQKICMDYNGAEDYVDAIKYIFYILCPRDTELDETYEIRQRCKNEQQKNSWIEEEVATTAETTEYIESLHALEEITECCQRRCIYGGSDVVEEILLSGLDSLCLEGEETEILVEPEGCIVLRDCTNVVFRNLNFRRSGDEEDTSIVIQIQDCNNIRWELCRFDGFQRTIFLVANSERVVVKAAEFNDMEGSILALNDSDAEFEYISATGSEKEAAVLQVDSSSLKLSNAYFNGMGTEEHVIQKENSKIICKNVFVN